MGEEQQVFREGGKATGSPRGGGGRLQVLSDRREAADHLRGREA